MRVGGTWSLLVRKDGSALPAGGEFLRVEPPSRLVQTRRYDLSRSGSPWTKHAKRRSWRSRVLEEKLSC